MLEDHIQKAKAFLAPKSGTGLLKFTSSPLKEVGRLGLEQVQTYDITKGTFSEHFGRFLPVNALYNDPIAKAGQMAPLRMGDFILFGQTDQSISEVQRVTSHPIAEGGSMADHVYKEPVRITAKGYIFETHANILEKAWMNKQLSGQKTLIDELRRGGMSTVDALKRLITGYQKRKTVVDMIRAMFVHTKDFRFTFVSNIATYSHMALVSATISEGLSSAPVEVTFDMIQVKHVRMGQVEAGFFQGVRRRKVAQKSGGAEGVGDSGAEDACGHDATSAVSKMTLYLEDRCRRMGKVYRAPK